MRHVVLIVMFVFVFASTVYAEDDTMSVLLGALAQSLAGGEATQGAGGGTASDRQLEYYTDPESDGYYEEVWGGVCRRCGEQFALSAAEINENNYVNCPNCRAVNNPAQAHRDYLHLQQKDLSQQGYLEGSSVLRGYSDPSSGALGSASLRGANSYSYGTGQGYTSSNRPGADYRWKIGESGD